MENDEIGNVIKVLNDLKEDKSVPKNVRAKIEGAIKIIDEKAEMHITVSRVLSELEEIADDVNLQSYTRTQVWDAISLMEKIS